MKRCRTRKTFFYERRGGGGGGSQDLVDDKKVRHPTNLGTSRHFTQMRCLDRVGKSDSRKKYLGSFISSSFWSVVD